MQTNDIPQPHNNEPTEDFIHRLDTWLHNLPNPDPTETLETEWITEWVDLHITNTLNPHQLTPTQRARQAELLDILPTNKNHP